MPDLLHASQSAAHETLPAHSDAAARAINLLAYVHIRNIHGSTGAGRVARQLIEQLSLRSDINLRVLADRSDHARIIPLVNQPWNEFSYSFLQRETSRQQAEWYLLDRPLAEGYWPETEIVYCTAESYVPTKKARLVVTVHDAAYFEADAHRRDRSFYQQRFKWQLLYRKLARKVDLFHTVSDFSADRLGHFFPAIRSRIRVVPNAVASHFFQPVTPSGSAYLQETGLTDRPFILVPGGLHFRKNADLILRAWPLLSKKYPDFTLAIVNHSNPEYVERGKQCGPSIRVLGFVSEDGLRALYSAAAAVWFPSRYEGFGLPVIEAMACGAAVVASRAASIPEIAGDAALLARPDSPTEHVDALDIILSDSKLQRELSKRGTLRAAAFTWQRSAEQLKGLFAALL